MAWQDLTPEERAQVRMDAETAFWVLVIVCGLALAFATGWWVCERMGT